MGRQSKPPGATDAQPRRAPKPQGHRARLTIPTDLWETAQSLAIEWRMTPNDAVVRLAGEGMRTARRRAEIESVANQRWDAFVAANEVEIKGPLPTADEAMEAVRAAWREDAEYDAG